MLRSRVKRFYTKKAGRSARRNRYQIRYRRRQACPFVVRESCEMPACERPARMHHTPSFPRKSVSRLFCGRVSALAPVAPAVDHLAVSVHADDLAVVRAAAAVDLTSDELHVLYVEAEFLSLLAAAGKDGRTDGPHEVSVLVNEHRTSELSLEGLHDADVLGDAALEHDRRQNLFPLAHVVQIVPHNSLAQARHDVLPGVPHLDLVDQVGLRKNGAPGGDLGRVAGLQGDLPHLLYRDAQPVGLAGEECACSGGAKGVHGVVDGDAVFHQDYLGVLSTYLKDGADIRMERGGADCVSGDLVFHHGGSDHRPHQLTGAARGARSDDPVFFPGDLLFQEVQQLLHRADRVPLGPYVGAGHYPVVLCEDHSLGGDGSNIYSHVYIFHQCMTFFLISIMS